MFTHCPLCSSSRLRDMKGYEKAHLCRCRSCGFVFSRKIPSVQELDAFYGSYSYDAEYYISPITLKRYRELLQNFEPYRRHNRFLDVGCGNGIFLSVAKEMGWECYGVEYSKKAVEICREKGLKVFHGSLENTRRFIPECDVVVSIEVIEHLGNPMKEIRLIHSLLRPGGLLYITTPNFNALDRYRRKGEYNELVYPEHLSYFAPHTLRWLCHSNGFRKQAIETTGFSVSLLQLPVIKQQKENPFTAESNDEKLRTTLEQGRWMPLVKKTANALLTFAGLGNSLKGRFIRI